MTQFVVQIKFFGAFKKYGDGTALDVPTGTDVAALKKILQEKLGDDLVQDSALACNDVIVSADAIIKPGDSVAILPPVCGG